jgi:hypothetical protein
LRALAGLLAFFAIGHTVGVLKPPAGGSPTAAVYDTMRSVRFPGMGFERSYGEFYRGFGLFVSMEFAILAMIANQLSAVSRRDPRQALSMAITLEAGCVASAVLSRLFFFDAPIAVSVVAVVCSTVAIVSQARDARAVQPAS